MAYTSSGLGRKMADPLLPTIVDIASTMWLPGALPTIVGSHTEARVPNHRLHLTDSDLLRKLMLWAPGGHPLTVRHLADVADVSRNKVYALLAGQRPTVTRDTAAAISAAVGVHQGALFFEPLPTPMGAGTPTQEDTDAPQ